MRKIINKNNVNISYSCINNISKIIDSHNKKFENILNIHVIVKHKMNSPS